ARLEPQKKHESEIPDQSDCNRFTAFGKITAVLAESEVSGRRNRAKSSGKSSRRRALLAGGNFGSNQANMIDAHRVADIDDAGHVLKVHIWIALNEHDLLCASGEDRVQLVLQVGFGEGLVVD